MFTTALQALNDSWVGTTIREDGMLFPWLEVTHVIAISLVLGSIAIIDMRLLGIAGRSYDLGRLTRALLPMTWIGFAVALISGALMFSSQPITYFNNLPFRMKMLMLLAAGLNMAVFHLFTARAIKSQKGEKTLPLAAKTAGFLSMAIWVVITMFGRWIGFTMSPY